MRGLAQKGMTMMCVTHEMNFARDVADTIWFMDRGQILERPEPDKFFTAPQHPRASVSSMILLVHWNVERPARCAPAATEAAEELLA